jgi:hypothetical protein
MKLWDADARAAHVDEVLGRAPVLPVLSVSRLEDAVPLARTLVENGLPVLELTLRTEVALDAIHAIRHAVPQAIVGAGTVLDATGLAAAAEAGAQFAISPGASEALYAGRRALALALDPGGGKCQRDHAPGWSVATAASSSSRPRARAASARCAVSRVRSRRCASAPRVASMPAARRATCRKRT